LPSFRITRQYGHGRLRADIVIEEKVASELKYALATKPEYQRLIGQLEDYARWDILLIVVLAGPSDSDLVRQVSDHLERRFNALLPRARCYSLKCPPPNQRLKLSLYWKTRIVRIGNPRGVRIPKPLLEQAGLEDEVELRLVEWHHDQECGDASRGMGRGSSESSRARRGRIAR
jgi:hypothetical protein